MKAVAVIPARMQSSRFPGKPLAQIYGIPMVGHCYLRTAMCDDLLGTYVATCDEEIAGYIKSVGGKAIMTSASHERASDRVAEALSDIEEDLGCRVDVIVMVQGDEPMVSPSMISRALAPFRSSNDGINIVNLMTDLGTIEEFEDPNEVKVVVDNNGDAIYFSREPIPSRRKGVDSVRMLKQVCIIPFKREYLTKFNKMMETKLEQIESIDMLRVLENGGKVRMIYSPEKCFSVDTPRDLDRVIKEMEFDELRLSYS